MTEFIGMVFIVDMFWLLTTGSFNVFYCSFLIWLIWLWF